MVPETIALPTGVFLLLRDLIRERIGIWFEDEKRDMLAGKLSCRVAGLGLRTFLDYYYLLKYDTVAEAEWPRLTDTLSVQETYFWREIDQIQALVDVLIPLHFESNRGPIRIWCAACATGEEALSIAIAVTEAGWFDKTSIEIRASDVSPAALEKATRGIYRERSFRTLPSYLKLKHFESVDEGWRVAPHLHRRIQFSQANLLEPAETSLMADSTFVFCRNVFIYFSTSTVARVVKSFTDRMPTPGYLFVGASESLLRISTVLSLEEINGAFVYVKR